METETWDVIVIGGGPAGLSAALMLGRARRRVVVVDAGNPRNRFAAHMHGVLGHESTPPTELLTRGRAEVADYGVIVRAGTVESVDETPEGVTVVLADGAQLGSRAVIVATGLSDELPQIPGLVQRWGTSVLHCPYCHGWEFQDRRLGVVTTSPMGVHQAELVRQWSDQVVVFTAGAGELTAEQEHRLRSRGIRLIASPVVEVVGDGDQVTGVRTADGETVAIDAVYAAGVARPHDGFLTALGLARTETPFGSFLAVDATGKTSSDRIWAIGNVVNPAATVPMSIGAGAFTGGAVNMALVTAEFDAAAASASTSAEPWPEVAPADYWETRYSDSTRVWSGRVNAVLADVASGLVPGTALDLGCGEGADVIWLAEHGWAATGIDIAPSAIHRAIGAARGADLTPERARFLVADLSTLDDGEQFDLVTASFLHSPVELPRQEILRAAAGRVSPGGHLLITSHADYPPWADASHRHDDDHAHGFLRPDDELAQLDLDPGVWETVRAETRTRAAIAPDGTEATLDDAVILLRRR